MTKLLTTGEMARALGVTRRRILFGHIYEIRRIGTLWVYIGKTTSDPTARFNNHKHALRAGKHSSPKLQRDWDRYGEEAFEFHTLEPVYVSSRFNADERKAKLTDREQHRASVARETLYNKNFPGHLSQLVRDHERGATGRRRRRRTIRALIAKPQPRPRPRPTLTPPPPEPQYLWGSEQWSATT